MRDSKKRRLEAKGWKVGTAEEFLDLTPEETAFIELKLRLSESLRNRRKRKKLSQTAFAKLINSSQSRVAKMEGGDPSVSVDLLIRSLLALGASEKDIASALSPSGRPTSS
jgi:DNA-binding transcriptional regulator YiaG